MCANFDQFVGCVPLQNPLLTRDIWRFIELSKKGELYEVIRDSLGFEKGDIGRHRAKGLMFEVFFSSHRNTSADKKKLKILFPNLVALIDRFKKRRGDNQFVIELQKRESAIFIDEILNLAIQKGYDVISKHDSIICPKSQKVHVQNLIDGVLRHHLTSYNLKTSAA